MEEKSRKRATFHSPCRCSLLGCSSRRLFPLITLSLFISTSSLCPKNLDILCSFFSCCSLSMCQFREEQLGSVQSLGQMSLVSSSTGVFSSGFFLLSSLSIHRFSQPIDFRSTDSLSLFISHLPSFFYHAAYLSSF